MVDQGFAVAGVAEEGPGSGGLSRPQLEPEEVVAERDTVVILTQRVEEMRLKLRGLSRTVQEFWRGLGSGRSRQEGGKRGDRAGGCHAQS